MARKNKKQEKTLAMRVLEGHSISYRVIEYPPSVTDAESIAEFAGLSPGEVYKTLVAEVDEPGHKPLLVMIASNKELNLKYLAREIGVKKVHMARKVDAEKLTGLQTGGISALALLNKGFSIYIDLPAIELENVAVSAGKRGLNLYFPTSALLEITAAGVIEVT